MSRNDKEKTPVYVENTRHVLPEGLLNSVSGPVNSAMSVPGIPEDVADLGRTEVHADWLSCEAKYGWSPYMIFGPGLGYWAPSQVAIWDRVLRRIQLTSFVGT